MADNGGPTMWFVDAVVSLFASRLGSAVVAGLVSSAGVFGVMALEPRLVEDVTRPNPWTSVMDKEFEITQEKEFRQMLEQMQMDIRNARQAELQDFEKELTLRLRPYEDHARDSELWKVRIRRLEDQCARIETRIEERTQRRQ